MTDNEMQTVDLVVGPLESFDDAVAFGDALYGLEGVTRLALNEFEGNRASFTFTARSLSGVSESLARMAEFPVGSVEQAVDGTLQVRLGGSPAQASAMTSASSAPPAVPDPGLAPPPQPASADPFVPAQRYAEPPAIEEPWPAEPETAATALFEEPWQPQEVPASTVPETFFQTTPAPAEPPFQTQPAPVMERVATPANDPFAQPSQDWAGDRDTSPQQAEPTPLFPELEAGSTPTNEETPTTEVARVIEKLAAELRETAEHLARLASGLTTSEEASPAPAVEEREPWQSEPVTDTSELTWNRDLPGAHASTQYDVAPVLTQEELDGIAASDSWGAGPQAPEEMSSGEDGFSSADPEQGEEPKRWEAPRMPAVGAMAHVPGETGSPEFKSEAHNAQAIALATAMGRRPSQVQLMASGFASFGIANSFIAAVRQIAGVRNVAIAELDQGRLKLTLDYFGSDSLEAQLQQLSDFPHQVVRASGKEIEIQLMAA